jgi:tetratricopeptide (TPR) repeat protein
MLGGANILAAIRTARHGINVPGTRFRHRGAVRTSYLLLLANAVVLILFLAAAIWWLGFRPEPGPPPLPTDVVEELRQTRLEALGLLENQRRLEEASQLFEQLAELVPDELFPVQNLAVTRLILLKLSPREQLAERTEATRQAIESLLNRAPDSVAGRWMAADMLRTLPDLDEDERAEQMMDYLAEAMEEHPDFVPLYFASYQAAQTSFDEQLASRALEAIKRARELAPGNLTVLLACLEAQANAQDETIVETLAGSRELLRPLRRSIQFGANVAEGESAGTGQDVMELIDEGKEAAERSDWNTVYRTVLGIRNGVAPLESQKRDLRRVDLHPLEFVVFDFSPEFYRANPPPPPLPLTNTAVRLQPLPEQQQPRLSEKDGADEVELSEVRDFAVIDFDLDGRLELVVLTGSEVVVLKRQIDSGKWELRTRVEVPANMRGILVGDLDNDHKQAPTMQPTGSGALADPPRTPGADEPGDEAARRIPGAGDDEVPAPQTHKADPDLIVYGDAGVRVYENRLDRATGERALIEMDQPDELEMPRGVTMGILVDFDHDADLDLVLFTEDGFRLWSSRGNLTFVDVTEWSQLPGELSEVTELVAVDWDRDVDIDILVASPHGEEASLLENVLHGQFAWRELGSGFDRVAGASGLAVAELDGNVSWDLVTAGSKGVHALLTRTTRPGKNQFLREIEITSEGFRHLLVGDLNNDTYPDVLVWNDQDARLFLGGPDAHFEEIQPFPDDAPGGWGRGRLADLDLDGGLDWIVIQQGRLMIYQNEGGNRNSWLQVRAVGQTDNAGRAGHTGIGSLLEVRSEGRYQAAVVAADVTHFGLGEAERADALRIVWTNGVPQVVPRPDSNQVLTELMTLTGSCPYLYTWTGERFEFFTDCLWAAPIGMQVARGVVAPSRAWEYLKIPGDRLVARDGHYELQITEELWEAAYFDQVELLAVDHPEEIDIYSNEKVGPAEIAEFKIHTVREPRRPVAARDLRGRDVLPLILEEDGEYFQGWEVQLHQGLTEEHYLELDLGELDDPGEITLFLTGWIYPANTALNIAFSENPRLEGPRFPSVWTPNADGKFVETKAFIGFPGGKTKTIAIDLSDAFLTDDYRVQIRTTAQIYWDAAFFTVDEPEGELSVQKLPLVTADLHYRGFSARVPYQGRSPEQYLYDQVDPAPRWPPMRGRFTRYGDVRPLLLQSDGRLVVLGAGDELTLRFAEPAEPPPPGWRRDFLLYSVGWDKDANLNTLHGQDVEPLPYVEMEGYPYATGAEPSGPEFERYLRDYQTREQNLLWFWNYLHPDAPEDLRWSPSPPAY